jgi:hypothetical protein
MHNINGFLSKEAILTGKLYEYAYLLLFYFYLGNKKRPD